MRETTGDLWDCYGKPYTVILITTNGKVKANGHAVMGRGCAYEAAKRFPGIAKTLGLLLEQNGNVVQELRLGLWSFPVKHSWEMDGDLGLIQDSAQQLDKLARASSDNWILPRPGCGNGRLKWGEVKPVIEFLPDNVWVITKK